MRTRLDGGRAAFPVRRRPDQGVRPHPRGQPRTAGRYTRRDARTAQLILTGCEPAPPATIPRTIACPAPSAQSDAVP
ncbi:protein of unknown function [Thauera humireducens]|nr:protein of unknown function [Thauera humireducens]